MKVRKVSKPNGGRGVVGAPRMGAGAKSVGDAREAVILALSRLLRNKYVGHCAVPGGLHVGPGVFAAQCNKIFAAALSAVLVEQKSAGSGGGLVNFLGRKAKNAQRQYINCSWANDSNNQINRRLINVVVIRLRAQAENTARRRPELINPPVPSAGPTQLAAAHSSHSASEASCCELATNHLPTVSQLADAQEPSDCTSFYRGWDPLNQNNPIVASPNPFNASLGPDQVARLAKPGT